MVLLGSLQTQEAPKRGSPMRSTTVHPPGAEHRPFEFHIRFHAPLRGAEVVPCDTTPSMPHPTHAAHPEPEPQPKIAHASTQPPTSPTPPAPVAPPDHWPDTERQLKADRERIETVLREVNTTVANLRKERDSRIHEWQRAAVELAMTTATRLLHERVVSEEFPIDAKVRDMIAQLSGDVPVVVRLNPLDLELLKSRLKLSGDDSLMTGPDAPRFVSDSTLNRGECQVEGHESMLMSDVARELQEIREDLLRSLDNARS